MKLGNFFVQDFEKSGQLQLSNCKINTFISFAEVSFQVFDKKAKNCFFNNI